MPSSETAPAQRTEARRFANFEAVALLAGELREGLLQAFLENHVRIVKFEPGRIEFAADGGADREMIQRLKGFLEEHSGRPWAVALARESRAQTLAEMRAIDAEKARSAAGAHPLVRAVLDQFPGAMVEEVRQIARPADPVPDEMPDPEITPDEDDI